MATSFSTYKTLFILKAFFFFCFFAFSFTCKAQEDTARSGRLSDIDTTIVAMQDADSAVLIDAPEEPDSEKENELEKNLFSVKNTKGGPDSFVLRTLDDSLVSVMKRDEDFWYANKAFHKKAIKENYAVPFWQTPGFQSVMWIVIIIAFVGFLILYLKEGNISIFRKTKAINNIEEAESSTNIFVINYQKEIDKAIASADYRLATRLLYLRLLKNLSEKGAIQYTQDKTNFDYLVETSSKSWYNLFFSITRHYEYVWYGKFDVDSDKFQIINKEFTNFDKVV